MELVQLELLGFAAGAINLMSSIPQLVANLRNPLQARGQSPSRNCFQCAGNALWMLYGVLVGSASMVTFACLGCLMAGGLILQTLPAQKRGARSAAQPAQAA